LNHPGWPSGLQLIFFLMGTGNSEKGIQKNILAGVDGQLALFSKGFVIRPTKELIQHLQIIHNTIIYYRITLGISII